MDLKMLEKMTMEEKKMFKEIIDEKMMYERMMESMSMEEIKMCKEMMEKQATNKKLMEDH